MVASSSHGDSSENAGISWSMLGRRTVRATLNRNWSASLAFHWPCADGLSMNASSQACPATVSCRTPPWRKSHIGRESLREHMCRYVEIWVIAVPLYKHDTNEYY